MFTTFLLWETIALVVVLAFVLFIRFLNKKEQDKKNKELYNEMKRKKERNQRFREYYNNPTKDEFKKYCDDTEDAVSSKSMDV